MFDYILNKLFCPFCGELQDNHSFQTKDFSCNMKGLDVYKIRGMEYEIYTVCDNCKNWIKLIIDEYRSPKRPRKKKKK